MKHYWQKYGLWGLLIFQSLLLLFLYLQARFHQPDYQAQSKLAQRFLLTDFCFSTESRHTRHLNFPELVAPFQDFPGGMDHFPSSSFMRPNPEIFELNPIKKP